MSKESTAWKRDMKLYCTNSPTRGHCWHFAEHNHPSLDRCCFCKMSGEQMFGPGYSKEKQAAVTQEKKKK